jgi:hypothetical protein
MAGYQRAMAVVRIARATLESADAQKALDDGTTQLRALESSRAKLEDDSADLEKRLQIAQQRMRTAASGQTSPEREAARRSAATALVTEARLICGAAKMVAADAGGLAAARAEIAAVVQQLEGRGEARFAPIDAAAQSRADCLEVLTRARRTSAKSDALVDRLFSELSATGAFNPSADERGVVVTLRGASQGTGLTDAASHSLAELGRVAAAHPNFAIQVVVHDAIASAMNDARDVSVAKAAVQALVTGGADPSSITSELAGARAPVADPTRSTSRARNERLEVVFVGR